MYIVAIGWAYVILMMAITASSVAKGLAILAFLGVLPIALFVYATGGRMRRPRDSMAVSDEMPRQRDAGNSEPD